MFTLMFSINPAAPIKHTSGNFPWKMVSIEHLLYVQLSKHFKNLGSFFNKYAKLSLIKEFHLKTFLNRSKNDRSKTCLIYYSYLFE